jgi:predicted aspartyl protease
MGTFTVGCLIKNHVDRAKSVQIDRLMVDTGSEATWIPRKQLEQAEIKPEKRQAYQMANGQFVYRDVGYAIVRVGQRETVDEIVFAERGDYIMLGARAMEGLLLWVDPKNKKLVEIEASPVAKVVVPGRVPPGKDQPLAVGLVIQGQGGPAPVAGDEAGVLVVTKARRRAASTKARKGN